ncbi:Ycf66 family protein [Dolichospermum planctonicum UHCC 0167]|uniref:Ycf66 family protein n=1 Tax=Dolichospermum planctonicum TaxID=136072 RepID=UPI0014431069|nr:Ycf66 family protein [Dolichospermum planctonicum]MCW9681540.1 Ycf66 family protein [Dolichospermum planctonicum UHCC 0167]
MLAYFIALVVAFGSLAIYLSAFFFPEIHRQNDFIWSGVGLFYALVLWIFAPGITGGLLLGHIASVALLVWFVSQTLSLRRQLAPQEQQTPLPSPELIKISFQEQMSKFSVKEKFRQLSAFIGSVFSGAKGKLPQTVNQQPVIKTTQEILQTGTTQATQPSKLPDESLNVTPAIVTQALSEETFSPSPVLEMVELAPTAPVIQPQEEQVIPTTEAPVTAEVQNLSEITLEVFISESSIAAETETLVEIIQTEVLVLEVETRDAASELKVSSPNPVTSELLTTEATQNPAMNVEEVKPDGEALPEKIPFNKPEEE